MIAGILTITWTVFFAFAFPPGIILALGIWCAWRAAAYQLTGSIQAPSRSSRTVIVTRGEPVPRRELPSPRQARTPRDYRDSPTVRALMAYEARQRQQGGQ